MLITTNGATNDGGVAAGDIDIASAVARITAAEVMLTMVTS